MSGFTFTKSFKRNEWVRFLKAAQPSYRVNALRAVLKNDGVAMLNECLQELGWERSVDLISKAAEEMQTNDPT